MTGLLPAAALFAAACAGAQELVTLPTQRRFTREID
jgi:hypothetical protein